MLRWLPELVAVALLPWLLVQGKHTRRNTPRLPEASGDRHGIAMPGQGTPLQSHPQSHPQSQQPAELIVIGESPVAGVGVSTQEQAITAQLAQQLAQRWQQAVRWQAYGKNGATVAAALQDLSTQLSTQTQQPSAPLFQATRPANAPARLVLIAFGVNDSTAFHRDGRYRQDLQAMLDAVQAHFSPDLIILSGAPPLHLFPALPQPLRFVLGLKAKALTRVAQQVAANRAHTLFVPVSTDTRDPRLMACDGYHPSQAGAAQWAAQLAEAVLHYQAAQNA